METLNRTEVDGEDLLIELQLIKEDPNYSKDQFDKVFNNFYLQYYYFVYQYCFKFFKTEEKAKDLCQNVFIQIYHSIDQFDPEKLKRNKKYTVKGWIGIITKNMCINAHKKHNKSNLEILTDKWIDNKEPIDISSFNEISSKEKKALQKAISQLSEKNRLLLFAYYNHLPITSKGRIPKGKVDELAKEFGVEKENFHKIRQRVFKKLKQLTLVELSKL